MRLLGCLFGHAFGAPTGRAAASLGPAAAAGGGVTGSGAAAGGAAASGGAGSGAAAGAGDRGLKRVFAITR